MNPETGNLQRAILKHLCDLLARAGADNQGEAVVVSSEPLRPKEQIRSFVGKR